MILVSNGMFWGSQNPNNHVLSACGHYVPSKIQDGRHFSVNTLAATGGGIVSKLGPLASFSVRGACK